MVVTLSKEIQFPFQVTN